VPQQAERQNVAKQGNGAGNEMEAHPRRERPYPETAVAKGTRIGL
jgi:hypothetical protein